MKFILIHFTIIIIIARPRPAQVDNQIETVQTGKLFKLRFEPLALNSEEKPSNLSTFQPSNLLTI